LDEFRSVVFIDMKDITHGEIIRYINLDRNGDIIDIQILKSAVNVCYS
jgi:hypothetical protein